MNTTVTMSPDAPHSRVEVITSVQRRRRWSAAEEVRLVEEAMQTGMSVSFVARRAGIAPSQLFAWKGGMPEGGQVAVEADEDVVGASRVRELQRLLGRKIMENEILKEAHSLARPKNRRRRSSRGIRARTIPDEGGRRRWAWRAPI